MPERWGNPKSLFAAVVFCGAVVVLGATLAEATLFGPQETEVPVSQLAARGSFVRAAPSEYPVRLRIGALGVDAAVQDVGVGKSGNMAVPSNYSDAGWYRYGPAAGQAGSAVFDGHVDNGFGRLGVFARLHELKGGEEISIENKKGEVVRFRVVEVREYAVSAVPLQQIFSTTGEPRLVLITCEGTYDPEAESYDHRLVVYAELLAS